MENEYFWSWLIVAEMIIVELPLFLVDFAAVTDWFYVSSMVLLIWRIIALVIDAAIWGILIYRVDRETVSAIGTMRTRGGAWTRSQIGYFIVPALVHLLIIVHWIPFRLKFHGLSPLSFTVNVDAFHVARSIHIIGEVLFASLVAAFWYYEGKHMRLHYRITLLQQKAPPQASSST